MVKKHCHTPDMVSLAMSVLPKGVAGQKGGVAKHSRRGRTRSSTSTVPTRTYDRTSCVTSIQNVTASGPSTMNFGYVHPLSAMPQSSVDEFMPSGSYDPPSSGNYGPSSSGSYGPHTYQPQQYSPHGGQPYALKLLTRQIHVCAGCQFGYCNTEKVPAPPYNICVAHKEARQVMNSHKGYELKHRYTIYNKNISPLSCKSLLHLDKG